MTRRSAWMTIVALLSMVGFGFPAGLASSPPTDLHKVGDHWTAWNPPPAGPDDYVITRGDTLWDLSQAWFGDPFLWPQIWDENRYIGDSHWIYPGDPLVVPGRPTVVPDTGEGLPVADATDRSGADRLPPQPEPAPLMPAAFPDDLYCTGFIEDVSTRPIGMTIVAADDEAVAVGQGDVVFIDSGRNSGVRAGDEYSVLRRTHEVMHPVERRRSLGTMVRRMGTVRVLIAHENSSTAVVTESCEDIRAGDELVPWEEIPVPLLGETAALNPLDPTFEGGPTGRVVAVEDDLTAFAAGHVIFTDLGYVAGVQPGDRLLLYRERSADLPRAILGRAVVLTVAVETSTAKIMDSTRESYIGDRVELRR